MSDPHLNTPPEALSQRLVDLEIRYSHLEDFCQQLSELVRRQGDVIDQLQGALSQLARRVPAEEPPAADAVRDRPPHY